MKHLLYHLTLLTLSLLGTFTKTQAAPAVLTPQIGHANTVRNVAWSPDGKNFLSASEDTTIKLWDAASGRLLKTLANHSQTVHAVAWRPMIDSASHTGNVSAEENRINFASASEDHTVKLWNITTNDRPKNLIESIAGLKGVLSIAWSPDGKSLAVAGKEKLLRIWTIGATTPRAKLSGESATNLTWIRNGTALAYLSDGKILKVWDFASPAQPFEGIGTSISGFAWSPDNQKLAVANGKTVRLHRATTGQLLRSFPVHPFSVKSLVWSPNGELLATGDQGGILKFWNATTNNIRTLPGHGATINSIAWNPNSKQIITGGDNHAIHLYDVATGTRLYTLSGAQQVRSLAWNPVKNSLAFASNSGSSTIQLWDVRNGTLLQNPPKHPQRASALAWSSDGEKLATAGEDKTLRFWSRTGQPLRSYALPRVVTSLAWTRDTNTLAGGGTHAIYLWNTTASKSPTVLSKTRRTPALVAWHPTDKSLAYTDDLDIWLWDAASRKTKSLPRKHQNSIKTLAWSPDGKILASAGNDNRIRFWNTVSNSTSVPFPKFTNHSINSLVWSPDGKILASAGWDEKVRLWNATTHQLETTFEGHTSPVNSLAFSPDGKYLISGSDDTSIQLWSISDRKPLLTVYRATTGEVLVVDRAGRFDGTPASLKELHYVVKAPDGLEPVGLEQMKDLYWEPDLWRKVMEKKPLKSVPPVANIPLPPDIKLQSLAPDSSRVRVSVGVRDGGLGPIEVYVNNVLYRHDARPQTLPSGNSFQFEIQLSGAPTFLPDKPNSVRLLARTKNHLLRSRSINLSVPTRPEEPAPQIKLFALVAGVSSYANPSCNLNYASRDAYDFSIALRLAAQAYGFKTVKVECLTSPQKSGTRPVTKAELIKALDEIKLKAGPQDVIVIYLSGHGISLGGERTEFLFPTQEAVSTEPQTYRQTPGYSINYALSSGELAKWLSGENGIKARHRVVILDTCGAGSASRDLSLIRGMDAETRISMDRFNDATGTFLLMGAAAGRDSYESSRYRQGLLTYALLQGMTGPALEDGKFLDTAKLFQHAQNTVPQLARGLGGIQQPLYRAPETRSVHIGKISDTTRNSISSRLAKPLPQIVRPKLSNKTDGDDESLLLSQKLSSALYLANYTAVHRGINAPGALKNAMYIDADTLAGALRPVGQYELNGEAIKVTLAVKRDNNRLTTIQATGTKHQFQSLVQKLVRELDKVAATYQR